MPAAKESNQNTMRLSVGETAWVRSHTRVTTPSVPSDPMNSWFRSGPTAAAGAPPVRTTRAVGEHDLQPDRDVLDLAVAGRVLAGAAAGHPTADGGDVEALREVADAQAVLGLQLALEVGAERPGEHLDHACRLVDGDDAVQRGGVEHDATERRHRRAGDPAAPTGDKAEVVMLGGHMDSWHSSTGATDNAAGTAVAMEAARIIIASGLKPRRTIRVALWSGEEQGLNGSREYVKQHFGEVKAGTGTGGGPGGGAPAVPAKIIKKADYEKLSAYYNLDNGTGKIRGIYQQGNTAVAPIFRTWLMPFADMGANTVTLLNTGGTDHQSFDRIGLPGFQFIQDEIEYSTRTHHSNQDNYDRIQADDMKQAATIMAAFVYQTAMMDEKIPKKSSEVTLIYRQDKEVVRYRAASFLF